MDKVFAFFRTRLQVSKKKYAILNADDPNFEYFYKSTPVEVVTYGLTSISDVFAKNIKMSSKGIHFLLSTFKGDIEIDLKLVGKFNVYNALASITAALVEGITLEQIKSSLLKLEGVKGRMEIVDEDQEFLVLVDYAHTPDALESVLKTTKDFAEGKIITVFGCGGDRDREQEKGMRRTKFLKMKPFTLTTRKWHKQQFHITTRMKIQTS